MNSIPGFTRLLIVLALLLAPLPVLAQETRPPSAPLRGTSPVALPAGDTPWTLDLTVTGGFSGADDSEVLILSSGSVTVSMGSGQFQTELPEAFIAEIFPELTRLISEYLANNEAARPALAGASGCMDCHKIVLRITGRKSDGTLGISASTSDETTPLPIPVARIHQLIEQIRGAAVKAHSARISAGW